MSFVLLCSQVSEAPSKKKLIVRKYWTVSEEVDKALLRQAVQDFCGQFPVFRLQEVDLSMLSSTIAGFRDDGRTRFGKYYFDLCCASPCNLVHDLKDVINSPSVD